MNPLQILWHAWKRFGEAMSLVVNTLLMAVIYIVAVTPIALIRKLFVKRKTTPAWEEFGQEDSEEALRRQF